MEIEGILIVADWLNDPTNGVNALLAGVPRYARTGHTLPPNVTIYNEIETPEIVEKDVPHESALTLPALFIYEAAPVEVEGHVQTEEQNATVQLVIGYVVRKSDGAQGVRDARYTMRAVRRSLVRLNDTIHQGTLGTANGVDLIEVQTHKRLPAAASVSDSLVALNQVTTIVLRDSAPRG